MSLRHGQLPMPTRATAASANDRLVPVQVYLGFELAPQFVVFRALHVTAQ